MAFAGSAEESADDYSSEATVVRFDPPLPLLRAPVRSSAPRGEGPVLAFRDAASWRAAWEAAEASLVSQCEVTPIPPVLLPPRSYMCMRSDAKFWDAWEQCEVECRYEYMC